MPLTDEEMDDVTELTSFLPTRVDGVGKGANGFPILMLKQVNGETTQTEATLEDVLAELDKAEEDARPPCPLCKGSKTIKDGHVKCPKCLGTGFAPKVGESTKAFLTEAAKESGVAASGATVLVDPVCHACNGSGQDESGQCDACAGTGKNADAPPASELNAVDGDPGKVTVGAGGRETDDGWSDHPLETSMKAIEDRYGITEAEYLSKKDVDPNVGGGVDRDKIAAEDFAGKNRSFPIVKPGDVSDAASSIGRAGVDNYPTDKLKANIIAIAKRKGAAFVAELPKAWMGAEKAAGSGGMLTGSNPALASAIGPADDDGNDDDANSPGSPAWEAVDADMANQAALALVTAAELIRQFANREQIEVAAGEGNDVFDAYAATSALCGVNDAIGIMTTLAFHEGLEAAKGLPDDETVEKAGRRLAGKTVAALASVRDKLDETSNHLTGVLGDDDPKNKNDETTKSVFINDQEVISMELTTEEFDSRVASAVVKALTEVEGSKVKKGKSAKDNAESIASAKDAKAASDDEDPKEDEDDLEDEADQGDHASANNSPSPKGGGAKKSGPEVELTPEQIEARAARKAAKKELRKAEEAEKQAAEDARLSALIVERVEKSNAEVDQLKNEIEAMKQRLVPSTIARTATTADQNTAKARDIIDMEIAKLERLSNTALDPDIAKGARSQLQDLYARRTTA